MLLSFIFFKVVFFILYWSIVNNIVSGVQQSESILSQVIFLFRLLQNIDQSSLCYTGYLSIAVLWLV